ncbi:hypothetical protein AYM40_25245 [Paraburkholderia phytofirmans OLGA172]|uniref:Nitroreductase domain-containing protein n=1 Tax=Paraburkholderia phytofirmans OLGA172 TaxID=1417228 RepID=A0A160FRK7_9BURK|nr:nitroreductase family protein [Paraburkholderia phytofirmans]ANB75650.1 hypothetical protein AYM40_25245 [Paraburkholderia phytofirmans OLGA172]
MNLKIIGRSVFTAFPPLRQAYWRQRRKIGLLKAALYHIYDALHTYRHMRWEFTASNYWKLSSELIFQFHKLEKGLCMPGPARFFGHEPAFATVGLIDRWRQAGYPTSDSIYLGALETVRAYRRRLDITAPPEDVAAELVAKIDKCLQGTETVAKFVTPMSCEAAPASTFDTLRTLCESRRSVRAYAAVRVSMDDVKAAIALAQLSPSACNRQPWHVHVYEQRSQIDALLALQNGNAGFGQLVQMLLVITVDSHSFFDGSERNQAFIDAGLFSMTLILALHARGLSSCCLNWCVSPDNDMEAHERGAIPGQERIIMYMAVGVPAESSVVPRSARRDMGSVLIRH